MTAGVTRPGRLCDYLPLSTTALAAPGTLERLCEVAMQSGNRIWIPQGALVGAVNLAGASPGTWHSVHVTMRKHPDSIDFSEAGRSRPAKQSPTVLFDGPVRQIAAMYPNNVNAMVTCALGTVGVDQCRARLIADNTLVHGELEVEALGVDGSRVAVCRQQPMVGVSGTEMVDSLWGSVLRATDQLPTLAIV